MEDVINCILASTSRMSDYIFASTSRMCWTAVIASVVSLYLLKRIMRSLKVGNYTEKSVFITGCDSGFGRALALHLDKLGFQVFAACLTRDGAKSLSECSSSRLLTIIVDVTKTTMIEAARDVVKQKLPPGKGLWAVVNNAAITGNTAAIELVSKNDLLTVLETNLVGYFEVTRIFLPLVRKAKGRVVNMASVAGRIAAFAPPYTMSKWGVEAFSDVLRREVARMGIKVSILEPGAFSTNLFSKDKNVEFARRAYEKADPEIQNALGADYVKKYDAFVVEALKNECKSLDPVINAFTHAITARYPLTRYQVGVDSRFIFVPISLLPDFLGDFFCRLVFKN